MEDYYFPLPQRLDKRLKDVLECNVGEKYYLNDKTIKSMIEHCERKQAEGCGFKFDPKDGGGISQAITTAYGGRQTDCYIKEDGTTESKTNCEPRKVHTEEVEQAKEP